MIARMLLVAFLASPSISAALAADQPLDGNWKVSFLSSPSVEITNWIVKLETRDGKLTGTLIASNPRLTNTTLRAVESSDGNLRVVLKNANVENVFEASLRDVDKDAIRGTFDDERRVYIGQLTRTPADKLEAADLVGRRELPPPLEKATALSGKLNQLLFQVQQAREPEEKIKLLEDAIKTVKESQTALPALHQEIIDKHPESVAVFDTVLQLLRSASTNKASQAQVQSWADAATKAAKRYGPGWEREIAMQIAQTLSTQKEYAGIAAQHADMAAQRTQESDPAGRRRRVLKLLASLQQASGQTEALRQTEARLEQVEQILDKEYFVKIPPLKTEAFAGRKSSSDRTVVMELFTGAECGPCVAADVAFDALSKAYKPSELILLQHHLHVPNSDPLTNPDTVARMRYYGKKYPSEMRGSTPSTTFNGKPQAGGGGNLGNAPNKLKEYRDSIDEQLEQPAAAKVAVSATAVGDKIDIKVSASDIKGSKDDLRLMVALVEDNVRYQGGNRLRFHHYVVRAMPTGAEGAPLPAEGQPYTTSVDLSDLRSRLNKYLDEYAATKPFPNTERPMQLKKLRVVAFLQDDKTREIVQAASAPVGEDSARR